MSTHHDLTQGDTGEQLRIELTGVSSTFSGATVVTDVWPAKGGAVQAMSATVADGFTLVGNLACGVLTVSVLDAWLATAFGSYKMVHRVTMGSGAKLTWPAGPPDTVHVGIVGT